MGPFPSWSPRPRNVPLGTKKREHPGPARVPIGTLVREGTGVPEDGRASVRAAPATGKGRQARDAITAAAARLMHERGIAATTLDDVLTASGTGKSQLYHYFGDKDGLTAAVLEHQFRRVMAAQPSLSGEREPDLLSWRTE